MVAEARLRFAELVSALAVAQDHCFGQPPGSQQRGALVSLQLAEALNVGPDERATVYWTSLLRFLGCTGHAHEVNVVFGDDIAMRSRTFEWDHANPGDTVRALVREGGRQHRGVARLRAVVALLAGGRKGAELGFRMGCEVADQFARRLGVAEPVRHAVAHSFERWNGNGFPRRVKGDAIPLAARIALLGQEFEVLSRVHGVHEATSVVRRRAGSAYDPSLVDVLARVGPQAAAYAEKVDPWDEALALDPEPERVLTGDTLDAGLEVAGDFADLKSPFTAGHSRGVADLAAAATAAAGLSTTDQTAVRRAALIHDIGRCAVSNAVWDKPGPLNRDERDEVELHSLRSEQLWRRCEGLAPLVTILSHHHERADGRGYHRGLPAAQLPLHCRLLAAADCAHALREERPHRPAMPDAAAAAMVRRLATDGHLDPVAADAVLAAWGEATSGKRSSGPAGLTAREIDVLRLIARGLTTKQAATELAMSPKTADTHVQRVYSKIGVSTRGAAALFAMQHGLVS
jgi:HD-GYP domain-containing protein (c-di-GMP phosphodiesterase class II)